MTYEERLEAAERHRAKGNALFQQVRLGRLFWVICHALHPVELFIPLLGAWSPHGRSGVSSFDQLKGNSLVQQVSLGSLFWVKLCAVHLVELHHTLAWRMEPSWEIRSQ